MAEFKVGQRVTTADGDGTVMAIYHYGFSKGCSVGVKHDIYPPNRVPGMFTDDVLYYVIKEVTHLEQQS